MAEQNVAAGSKSETKDLTDLRISLNLTRDFLTLVELLDTIPNMEKVPYDVTRSLYQAVSKGRTIEALGKQLEGFFGPPKKPAGKQMPVTMKFHPIIKYLKGVRDEQALYARKTKNGYFYGALWPWYKKPENITVHLGYCGNKMSGKDFKSLERNVKSKLLNEKVFAELAGSGSSGIQGISLASFLHMAQLDKITCGLTIKNGKVIGRLHLFEGELIGAETGSMKNKAAAYEIISWSNTEVMLAGASPKKKNEINTPLMDILSEALRLRKQKEFKNQKAPAAAATIVPMSGHDRYKALRDAQRERKSPLVPIIGGAVLVVLIITAGAMFGTRYLKAKQVENEYLTLLNQIENFEDPEDQKILLANFIESHEDSRYSSVAQEKQEYRYILDEVAKMPIDEYYEAAATDFYNRFLEKYPESSRYNEIQMKIAEIPDLIDDIDYQKLEDLVQFDYNNRIEAYLDYLVKHPGGRHKTEVEALVADMSEEYFAQLMKVIPGCDQANNWDRCILLCKNFLKYFKNNHRTYEVEQIQGVMQDKKDLTALMEQVRMLGDRYKDARAMLVSYLESNPYTTQVDRIKAKIDKLDANLRESREWENVLALSQNSRYSLSDRVNQLGRYIQQNPSSRFVPEAKKILTQLRNENRALYQARIDEERARQQEEIARRKQLIGAETQNIIAQISHTDGRFQVSGNGTFIDARTGKTWALLDSSILTGKCFSHAAASDYVKKLNTGGFSDWRLPFGSELAEIYKSEPFFPGSSAPWYWTSEVFVKGYTQSALVVTSVRETGFDRIQKEMNDCGAVRAVRP